MKHDTHHADGRSSAVVKGGAEGRAKRRGGSTHRLSHSKSGGVGFDSFMHRLWLFSCSHSPPWPLREGRKEETKRRKKTEKKWQIINLKVFPVSISEDLMHNVIKADLKPSPVFPSE